MDQSQQAKVDRFNRWMASYDNVFNRLPWHITWLLFDIVIVALILLVIGGLRILGG
jgi:hypothetical protein